MSLKYKCYAAHSEAIFFSLTEAGKVWGKGPPTIPSCPFKMNTKPFCFRSFLPLEQKQSLRLTFLRSG